MALAPSGSVLLVTRWNTTRALVCKRVRHQSCAHPAVGETRKRSVPCRVHSLSKELWFVGNSLPTSNPHLTRGAVESPSKRSVQGKAAASNHI
jgi:hypothetical protein